MALLPILHHPDERLRRKAKPVTRFDAELLSLIEDMLETMYDAPGVGLAATQVGVALRVAVMDTSEERNAVIVMVNPEIVERSDRQDVEEGCLSVPDYRETIQRYSRVRMRALDAKGESYEMEADGLAAQCIQHEIDHLDGRLYIDYLSSIKRERLRKRMAKEQSRAAGR
jgi:peptide deformylase